MKHYPNWLNWLLLAGLLLGAFAWLNLSALIHDASIMETAAEVSDTKAIAKTQALTLKFTRELWIVKAVITFLALALVAGIYTVGKQRRVRLG